MGTVWSAVIGEGGAGLRGARGIISISRVISDFPASLSQAWRLSEIAIGSERGSYAHLGVYRRGIIEPYESIQGHLTL